MARAERGKDALCENFKMVIFNNKRGIFMKIEENRIKKPLTSVTYNEHWISVMSDPWYKALYTIQDVVVYAAHTFFRKHGLKYLLAPITTGSISSPMGAGSDSLPVKIVLNNTEVYLADSMQFALEYGCRLSDKGSYYIMQCFRGEEPDESHLSQFCHIEFEIPETLDTTMRLAWSMVRFISEALVKEASEAVGLLAGTIDHLVGVAGMKMPPSVSFVEAVNSLNADDGEFIILDNGARTLTKKGEQKVSRLFGEDGIIWIKNMDKLSVPFYQSDSPEGQSCTADLLIGGRETIGSGERHSCSEDVLRALRERQVDEKDYGWYLTMKQQKPMLTSGMGMGLERYLMWVTGSSDIRNIPLISRLQRKINTP